ncbi:GtrA family protein [Tsuneonella sp. HG249]
MALADRLPSVRALVFPKYLVASVVALAADVALFLQLIAMDMSPAPASAISYSVGIFVHWLLSSRIVFHGRVARGRRARAAQQLQFVVSALIGLALTTGIVATGSYLGLDPRLAKLVAIGVSFVAVWHIRNRYVFRTGHRGMVDL